MSSSSLVKMVPPGSTRPFAPEIVQRTNERTNFVAPITEASEVMSSSCEYAQCL